MKALFLKLFKIILLCSLMAGSSFATVPSLSNKSKYPIVASAFEGGITGLSFVGFAASLRYLMDPTPFPMTNQELKEWGIAAAAITAIGALVGGACKYFSLPEKHFSYAKKEISRLCNDAIIGMVYKSQRTELINALKGYFCRNRYPLTSAFYTLNAHYDTIVKVKSSLTKVLNSEDKDLHQEAQELQAYADATLKLLKEALSAITAEPNFTSECAARAQEQTASAMRDAAFYQSMHWLDSTALQYPQNVYVHHNKPLAAYQKSYSAAQREVDWQMTRDLLGSVQN